MANVKQWIKDRWDSTTEGIKKGAGWTWDKVAKGSKWTWGKVADGSEWTWGKVADGSKWTWGKVADGAKWTWGKIADGSKWTWGKIADGSKWTWGKIWSSIKKIPGGLWISIRETTKYLWGGIKMSVVDLVKGRSRPSRGLKQRLQQAAAVTLAGAGMVFGGMKGVQHYTEQDFKEYKKSMTYIYTKNSEFLIDTEGPVFQMQKENINLSKLTRADLRYRQRFLNYVHSYLTTFLNFDVSSQPGELAKLPSFEERKKHMQRQMGLNLLEKARRVQEDENESTIRDHQICDQAAEVATQIVDSASKEDSVYGCFDRVKKTLVYVEKSLQKPVDDEIKKMAPRPAPSRPGQEM